MKIRKFRPEDAVEVVRLHRSTIRHVNSKDYLADIIKVWSGGKSAKRLRKVAANSTFFVALIG